jgi:hypothetical protein
MKITRERTNKQGKRIVTVELDDGEHIQAIKPNSYYRTGYPQEDVVGGYILLDSVPVTWCSLGQEWAS